MLKMFVQGGVQIFAINTACPITGSVFYVSFSNTNVYITGIFIYFSDEYVRASLHTFSIPFGEYFKNIFRI